MALISFKVPQYVTNTLNAATKKLLLNERELNHHITLCYLGDDYAKHHFFKAVEVVSDIAEKLSPLLLEINMMSFFPPKRGIYPVILPIEAIELQDLQVRLFKALDKENIPFSNDFKVYRPHLTLGYSNTYPKSFIENITKMHLVVDSITLCPHNKGFGNEVTIPLLGGMSVLKNMSDPADILKQFSQKMAARLESAKTSAPSNSENAVPPRGAKFNRFIPNNTPERLPCPSIFSPTPNTHRVREQVTCPGCTAWIVPERGCFRCQEIKEAE